MRPPRWRTVGTSTAGATALAVALASLQRLGTGPLAAPPRSSWGAIGRWYDAVGPEVAVLAVVRLVALALASWLLAAMVLQLVAAVSTLAALRRLADLVSPRSLQRFGPSLAGLSLTAGLAAPVPSAGLPAGVLPSVDLVGWPAGLAVAADDPPLPPAVPAWPTEDAVVPGTATLRLLDDGPVASSAPVPTPGATADTVTVASGDSLWSIAEDQVADGRGAPPGEREVAAYWRRLVAANRAALVDPGNPDLIYPGQVVTLPSLT